VAKLLATHARLKEDAGINFCLRDSGSSPATPAGGGLTMLDPQLGIGNILETVANTRQFHGNI